MVNKERMFIHPDTKAHSLVVRLRSQSVSSARTILVLILVSTVLLAGCAGTPLATDSPQAEGTSPSGVGGTVSVHFINVGQSVATLVIGPTGETMLIDSGDFTDDGEHVLAYLKRHDIDHIDYLVTSHGDADHIGGHANIIEYYETEANGIGAIYDPGIAASTKTYQQYLDAVEKHNVTLYETREGDSIPFKGVDVSVLGPPEPYLENEARNENSIVLRLAFGKTSFLFTGDAEDDQEQYLVEKYGTRLRSTVLKAGHHGSKSSTGAALLDAVDPKTVVISSAYESRYDHPAEEMLQRLADRSIPAYWTATHGDIVLESDGQRVVVKTQQKAPTDPTSLREGESIDPGTDGPVERRATISGDGTRTASATPVATDGGTATGDDSGTLAVKTVHADAEGDDRANLNDEYVIFENTGNQPLDLSGWTIADEAGHTYTVPEGVVLNADATVALHSGNGSDTATKLYRDASGPVWNNGGDTIIVTNADGEEVLRETYS